MKKQLSLIAITGAAIVLASAGAHAQTQQPLPAAQFAPLNPVDAATTNTGTGPQGGFHSSQAGAAWNLADGKNPNVFTASGTIQKFIKFKTVDSSLELGDIGNPTFVGHVVSSGAVGSGTVVGGTAVNTAVDGLAGVTFDANTYVQVQAQGQNSLLNTGADGIANSGAANTGDDYRLPVEYALSAKGLYSTPTTHAAPTGNQKKPHADYGSAAGSSAFSAFSAFVLAPGSDSGYSASNMPGAAGSGNNMVVTFEPNGGASPAGATGSNGFQIAARVKRNGLNDYHGKYTGTVELKYWQW